MPFCLSVCLPTGMGSLVTAAWNPSSSHGWWRLWAVCPCRRWQLVGGTRPVSAVRGSVLAWGTGWQLPLCPDRDTSCTDGGDLYVWGWNKLGQLGLPSRAVAEEQAEDEDMGAGEDTVGLQQCWAQLWG